MKLYTIYDDKGEIIRFGRCPHKDFNLQVEPGQFILEGIGNDITQKVIDGKIVNKTAEEIEAEKLPEPTPTPYENKRAYITNGQLQDIFDRLEVLESRT